MRPRGDGRTALRVGVPAADAPLVIDGLRLRPGAARVRRLLVLETADAGPGAGHPLLDAGVTVQAEVGTGGTAVTVHHRPRAGARPPPTAGPVTWRLSHEWLPALRAPAPVHVGTAALPPGSPADGMGLLWDGRADRCRWIVLCALRERSWRVAVGDLDLTVRQWTTDGAAALDLLQIEHGVAAADAPFVMPVLRAFGVRLGIDPGLGVEPLDVRAVLGLTGRPA